MRKIVLQMMMTLNGRVDSPDEWVSGVPDDLYAEINRAYGDFDTILVGHTTYKEMFAYWPDALKDESKVTQEIAQKMHSYKKYVYSRTENGKKLAWNNSEYAPAQSDDDIKKFIAELKSNPGKDIHLSGGASLAQTFVRLGLVDEYHLYVYPVVSNGKVLFEKVNDKNPLKLISSTSFSNGVVALYYEQLKNRISISRDSF
ncbi:riboflavin biosynthesis protein RibD [Candidatus Peregrinibacteria bacterium CG11_big_fil_rev_8_21_14_0_20_41_10]|nr:MAG: riboflavin biosynthesis protein RibD [Candidatus Peregrinibacteria bacterium CG11_big_fil_rev_8_21_14_0_20_41_10]PIZ77829.1 MAG: riboflavin biosynthesis protein RibD [Candidatus Peregrinibacteria bacterium CG_4_10_14_0_2_um_filter_41_8]PJC38408.1 MAG: riboflavin biosynthesis protein RibD [Candidatus Peregrinibacteria bacterium CG_4_9_14_0_2_um_filter_41_14]